MKVIDLSEYKKTIKKLIDSDITGYQIYKETGLSQTIMSSLRNGSRKLNNITLETAEKLYNYQKKIESKENK